MKNSEIIESDHEQNLILPISALHPIQRAMMEATATTYQVDAGLAALYAIATTAAAIGKGAELTGAIAGHRQRCNLFTLLIAESGYGKDSAAVIYRPLMDIHKEIFKSWKSHLPHWVAEKENLEKGSKKKELTYEQICRKDELDCLIKNEPKVIVKSSTGAALGKHAAANGGTLFYVNPEAGDAMRIALGRFTSDKGGDADFLLDAFTGTDHSAERVARESVMIESPCLCVAWSIQPFLWRELADNQEALERGLMGRFIFYKVPHRLIPIDDGSIPEIPATVSSDWTNLIEKLFQTRESSLHFTATKEAAEVLRDFHNKSVHLRNGDYRDIQARLSRWRELAARIALGLAVVDHVQDGAGLEVTHIQAERAIELAKFYLESGLQLFEQGRQEALAERANKLASVLVSKGGSIPLWVMQANHGIETHEIERIVSSYPERFTVKNHDSGGRGGRPSRTVEILNFNTDRP